MPKWKKDATRFPVNVNHHPVRGYQSAIPKPVMELLGYPSTIIFIQKGDRFELVAGKSQTKKMKPKRAKTA